MTFLRKLFDFRGRVVAPFLGRVDAQIGAALELSGDDNKLKRLETMDAAYDGEVGRMQKRQDGLTIVGMVGSVFGLASFAIGCGAAALGSLALPGLAVAALCAVAAVPAVASVVLLERTQRAWANVTQAGTEAEERIEKAVFRVSPNEGAKWQKRRALGKSFSASSSSSSNGDDGLSASVSAMNTTISCMDTVVMNMPN